MASTVPEDVKKAIIKANDDSVKSEQATFIASL